MSNDDSCLQESEMIKSSGNVFADLGLPDAETRLLKSRIAVKLRHLIEAQRLKQTQIAEKFGIPQPRVSDIMRGRVNGYSVERLLSFVNRLGHGVEIVISSDVVENPEIRVS